MKKTIVCAFAALVLSAVRIYAQEKPAATIKMSQVSLLVKDYEETLKFYTGVLGFIKTADMQIAKDHWITIATPGPKGAELVLVKADTPGDLQAVGKQVGNRTLMVLETTQFDDVYKQYQDKNVHFLTELASKPWGRQIEFADLYGNRLVLLELKPRRQ
jgi:catechol 2,3-dioxygenase-like lactoylglutathione lyase family enzyme